MEGSLGRPLPKGAAVLRLPPGFSSVAGERRSSAEGKRDLLSQPLTGAVGNSGLLCSRLRRDGGRVDVEFVKAAACVRHRGRNAAVRWGRWALGGVTVPWEDGPPPLILCPESWCGPDASKGEERQKFLHTAGVVHVGVVDKGHMAGQVQPLDAFDIQTGVVVGSDGGEG